MSVHRQATLTDLPPEVIVLITNYLTDKEKLYLTSGNRHLRQLKQLLVFTEPINVTKICSLTYFNNFSNIIVDSLNTLPKLARALTFSFTFQDIIPPGYIPTSVIYVSFNQSYKKDLSLDSFHSNITKLTLPLDIKNISPS